MLEAEIEFKWHSLIVAYLLGGAGVLFFLFMVNEFIVSKESWGAEPIFPWRFLRNREWMGTLLQVGLV